MGIDPKTLSPAAQAQIAEKLLQNMRVKPGSIDFDGFEKQRKYRNTPDARSGAEGYKIRFDSKTEARRYDELMLMLKAGRIRNLKLQPQFTIQESFVTPDGERIRAVRYHADFSYEREKTPTRYFVQDGKKIWCPEGWETIVEDVKSRATRTDKYKLKKKLIRERFGIEITEVE